MSSVNQVYIAVIGELLSWSILFQMFLLPSYFSILADKKQIKKSNSQWIDGHYDLKLFGNMYY